VVSVSERAGELLQEWIDALEYGVKVHDIARAMHVCPTFSRAS
jgi:pyruvate/2-oxoglutarate dehydrogenase complex dihydrolipoamide dehydrogenase (E3) component